MTLSLIKLPDEGIDSNTPMPLGKSSDMFMLSGSNHDDLGRLEDYNEGVLGHVDIEWEERCRQRGEVGTLDGESSSQTIRCHTGSNKVGPSGNKNTTRLARLEATPLWGWELYRRLGPRQPHLGL